MSDSYQAIYDAVRSRISNGDISSTIEAVLREANLSHYAEMVSRAAQESFYEYQRPSVLYRPSLNIDGNMWFALYGQNLQEGVAGFGDSPADAMSDFDRNWNEKISEMRRRSAQEG